VKELLELPCIVGVSGTKSLTIYVEKITHATLSTLTNQVKQPFKVHPIGRQHLLGQISIPLAARIYQSRTAKQRPKIHPGCSIGSPFTTAGTLSCTAKDLTDDKTVGLSCNHCIGPIWGNYAPAKPGITPTLQPGIADGAKLTDQVGVLKRIIPVENPPVLNLVDIGCFDSTMLAEEIMEVGKPSHAAEPKKGQIVLKSGRSTGVTYSRVLDTNVTLKVYVNEEYCIFEDCVIVDPRLGVPCDSGSAILNERYEVVGFLFAGSSEVTVGCKASHVEKFLNVRIATVAPYVSLGSLAVAWGGIFTLANYILSPYKTYRE